MTIIEKYKIILSEKRKNKKAMCGSNPNEPKVQPPAPFDTPLMRLKETYIKVLDFEMIITQELDTFPQ